MTSFMNTQMIVAMFLLAKNKKPSFCRITSTEVSFKSYKKSQAI